MGDTLYTAGFVYDIMISHNRANSENQRQRISKFARWWNPSDT